MQRQSNEKTIQYGTSYVRGKKQPEINECSILHSVVILIQGINKVTPDKINASASKSKVKEKKGPP
jgi:hypothetical protein